MSGACNRLSGADVALNTDVDEMVRAIQGTSPWHKQYVPRLYQGVWDNSSTWLAQNLTGAVILEKVAEQGGGPVTLDQIREDALARIRAHGLSADDASLNSVIDLLLTDQAIIRNDQGALELGGPYEMVAIRTQAIPFLRNQLAGALSQFRSSGNDEELAQLLARWGGSAEEFALYRNEAKWPMLKAVASLDPVDSATLFEVLDRRPALKDIPLWDQAQLAFRGTSPDWIPRFAPELQNRRIYTVAAEGWGTAAGGLGRVQQYHSAGMAEVAGSNAEVVTVEPRYQNTRGPDGQPQPVDWEAIRARYNIPEAPNYTFRVTVAGNVDAVEAEAWVGRGNDGITRIFISDKGGPDGLYQTRQVYSYGENGSSSWPEFSEFMSRASLKVIEFEEAGRERALGEGYRGPVIIANDAQLALLPRYWRELQGYSNNGILQNALIHMTTHTHNNRQYMPAAGGEGMLASMGVPDWELGAFRRLDQIDVTSGGVRQAHSANGVAALHRDRVSFLDPDVRLLGITNGDILDSSSARFQEIFNQLYPGGDSTAPTPEQLTAVKREAKVRLNEDLRAAGVPEIDPNRMVVSYSGRLVGEKVDVGRAWSEENIRRLVGEGVQVVLYGNVQSGQGSRELFDNLSRLAGEINNNDTGGRLVVRTGWDIGAQVNLLAATDVQVQDSDFVTGASEYTESNVTRNGGLSMGSPWQEGVILSQGSAIDFNLPGSGNTLVPATAEPAAYLDRLLWANTAFREGTLALYQARSVRYALPLTHRITGAAYLESLAKAIRFVR